MDELTVQTYILYYYKQERIHNMIQTFLWNGNTKCNKNYY